MRPRGGNVCLLLTIAVLLGGVERARAEVGVETRLSMAYGGESIASVSFIDGKAHDLKLGTYFTLALGARITVFSEGQHAMEVLGLAGWASSSAGSEFSEDHLKLRRQGYHGGGTAVICTRSELSGTGFGRFIAGLGSAQIHSGCC